MEPFSDLPTLTRATERAAEKQADKLLDLAIARKQERVTVLDDMHSRLLRVVQERGEEMAGETAGGSTGLLVRKHKSLGAGPLAEVVKEYEVDTGLLAEIRRHQELPRRAGSRTRRAGSRGRAGDRSSVAFSALFAPCTEADDREPARLFLPQPEPLPLVDNIGPRHFR